MAYRKVRDVMSFSPRGPWDTKSGGKLTVLLALPYNKVIQQFFRYDASELAHVPSDIRGFRSYTVMNLPCGRIGGTEFHHIREEIVFCLNGQILWKCEDVHGSIREDTLNIGDGLWMPPYILHTYEVLQPDSGLIVLANTLFTPDDPQTHDTYSIEEFKKLQSSVRQS
ncbi:MAG: WxcM-like domain-containing protein [Candidatus Niyogibacteria bacterium]|nr:MAG: WxcM-like domain-containing protein [Candidatus Niyogibacteria bacterium]